jgi:D-arginine utilization repressor
MSLANYIKICDNLVSLMNPMVETVIHDVASNKIVYIAGSLSKRKLGDSSLLDRGGVDDIDKAIYPKTNFDGRLIKSISVHLDDNLLLCINCDISVFNKMQELSQLLLISPAHKKPNALFASDWQEKLNMSIHSYLQEKNLSFENLNNADKKSIVEHLFKLGAFNEKNAADYVAKTLKLGRATVFKYLKKVRSL